MPQARVALIPAETPWDTVRRLSAAYRIAFEKGDLETMLSLYAPNARAVWPDMPAANGKPAIRALLKAVFKTGLRDVNLEVCVLTYRGDVAIEVGYYALKTTEE